MPGDNARHIDAPSITTTKRKHSTMTEHTPGPWVWRSVWNDDNKEIALLLETAHRPVPCNDPVIFALREDWLGKLSPEREAAKLLLLAAPDLAAALEDLRKELRAHFKLDVKKHFSLMAADATAGTALHKARGGN